MEMIDLEAEQRGEDNETRRGNSGKKTVELERAPVKIVVGNKCDLKDGRQVSAREGLEYARRHGCGFMETSAREMVNIEETFARMPPPPLCFFLVGWMEKRANSRAKQ